MPFADLARRLFPESLEEIDHERILGAGMISTSLVLLFRFAERPALLLFLGSFSADVAPSPFVPKAHGVERAAAAFVDLIRYMVHGHLSAGAPARAPLLCDTRFSLKPTAV